jgi:peptidoglycan/LPS O-acetylase OafA/YrhL
MVVLQAAGLSTKIHGLAAEWFNALILNDDHKECVTALQDTLNHFWSDSTLIDVFLNSGKWANQIGNYDDCIKGDNTRYILMTLNGFPLYISLGICAPKKCTVKDFDVTKKNVSEALSKLLEAVKPKDLEINIKLTEESISFQDSEADLEGYTKITIRSLVAIMIIGSLFVLVIIFTVYCSYKSECKEANTVMKKIMCSFDFFRNLNGLIRIDERHDQKVRVFDGIRVGGMLWVIFGHTFMIMKIGPVENITVMPEYTKQLSKAHVYTATFSVDMFFYLSGFFLCFVLLSAKSIKVNYLLIIHRIIRLIPALLFSLAMFYCILPLFGGGPIFYYYMKNVIGRCSDIWWMIYTFTYNYRTKSDESCLSWNWYLSLDMQFFLISIPFIYVLAKRPKIGTYLFLALLSISYTVTIIVSSQLEIFSPIIRMTLDHSRFYYETPYGRIQPYFIGILTAYFYIQSKTEGTFPNRFMKKLYDMIILRVLFYLLGLEIVIFVFYAQYYQTNYFTEHGRWLDILNLVFARNVFVFGIFVFCLPAFAGKGRLLQLISGSNFMTILSRLSYGVYFTH